MSWLLTLLLAWIVIDVLIVAAVHVAQRASVESGPVPPPPGVGPSRRPKRPSR